MAFFLIWDGNFRDEPSRIDEGRDRGRKPFRGRTRRANMHPMSGEQQPPCGIPASHFSRSHLRHKANTVQFWIAFLLRSSMMEKFANAAFYDDFFPTTRGLCRISRCRRGR
jgi:hypothetical protein